MSIHELDLLKRILDEGVSKGVFIVHDTTVAAFILHSALKGLDVPYILNHFAKVGVERTRMRNLIADFLLYGIMKYKTDYTNIPRHPLPRERVY